MSVSRLDILYTKLLTSKFFTRGWGDPQHVLRLLNFRKFIVKRETCYNLVDKDHPIEILKQQTKSDCYVTDGVFISPLAIHIPEDVHPAVQKAFFQLVIPKKWTRDPYKPVCIHLAGTGDHYFWKRRQLMVKPLLKEGIASIILENPFYGLRKPKDQFRSYLLNVSDIFVMGGCLILECIALLHWCEKQGLGPLGVTGLSMGGHMASLAAASWPKPIVLVPCLSWSTASAVFTEGVLSEAIDWDFLQSQYFSNEIYHEILSKLCKIVDDPTESGLAKIHNLYNLSKLKSLTPFDLAKVMSTVKFKNSQNKEAISNELSKIYSFINSFFHKTADAKIRDKDAVWFMRGLMDECTHLKNFEAPVDTSLIIAICAQSDAYVPRDGCTKLEDIWPGATVKYLNCGHVGAYLRYFQMFRQSILEGFDRAEQMYSPPMSLCN